MAQPPGSPTTHLPDPEPGELRRRMAESPVGVVFHPKSRCLVDHYLVPRALHGHVPDDAVTEGVDVYATRPVALPFPRRNIARVFRHQVLWGYFFATRPEAVAGGDSSRNFRDVAGGGRWCWCCYEKEYADDDGEVYAFRTRFAFYEDDGKLTPWRMKEYRLNDGAARFRGVLFHPGAPNLVVWKVYLYCKVEIAQKVPPIEYSSCDHVDEDEIRAPKRIKTAIDQTHVPAPGKLPRCIANLSPESVFHPNSRELIDQYLIPRALHGRVPDHVLQDGVAEGVDVYATRPEALPFPSRNYGRAVRFYRDLEVWGYFFTTRPAPATAGGSSQNVLYEAAGGSWRSFGFVKGYAADDEKALAFRTKFAFHEDDGELTPWRMKEYMLNEDAPRFRGIVFHPSATNLVVWKVYKEVEVAKEPPMKYSSSDADEENEAQTPNRNETEGSIASTE